MVADAVTHPPILPIILAGGVGARLAPLSTQECPKPFVPWEQGDCLYRQTIDRLSLDWLPPLVVGREPDRFRLLNHMRDAGCSTTSILLEYQPYNTGLAVAFAAAWLEQNVPTPATLAILPADHIIRPTKGWQHAVERAAQVAAQHGKHCLLSVPATSAETGYGYMDADWIEVARVGAAPLQRFVEKPADPAPLIERGMQWNSGQCVVTLDVLIHLFQTYAPEYLAAARSCVGGGQHQYEFEMLGKLTEHDALLKPLPFDRLILEKSYGYVVPIAGEWCDMGTLPRWQHYAGVGQGVSRTDRPWGYFEVIEQDKNRILKKLTLYPGARLSLQKHQYRDEHWEVRQGTALVQLEDRNYIIEKNGKISIPAGSWHRLQNHGTENLIIIEEQHGNCSEEDIIRRDDDYGRI